MDRAARQGQGQMERGDYYENVPNACVVTMIFVALNVFRKGVPSFSNLPPLVALVVVVAQLSFLVGRTVWAQPAFMQRETTVFRYCIDMTISLICLRLFTALCTAFEVYK